MSVSMFQNPSGTGCRCQGATGGPCGGAGASRAQTLLPLLRKFLLITLVVVVVLVVLSALGISVGDAQGQPLRLIAAHGRRAAVGLADRKARRAEALRLHAAHARAALRV